MGADEDGPLAAQSRWLDAYRPGLRVEEFGLVQSVGDGIAWISGLPAAAMDEELAFADGSRGLVFDLAADTLGAILLHATPQLTAGVRVQRTGRALSVPVGDALGGRVIDPLGVPLDGAAPPDTRDTGPIEAGSPPIIERDYVQEPLYSGVKIIDTLVPIGKGQRQLLIGDEGLGRSSLAIDTVINQRGAGVQCVYVLIGQKRSAAVNTIATLRDYQALEYTTVVVAEASALPGLQHVAPFAGCAIAEHWMRHGRDVLIVYDDLSTHARNYRELSLLLRRPPGREAYPGDIFSVHARLLERGTRRAARCGGGSLTALPVVETQQGEISAYIPTNLISITDGQIYLDQALFAGGFRPAIDIGKSVSRIGGRAQHPRIRKEAGRIKLDYLQYLELEVFTRFGAKLEASMERVIARGRLLREILKQDRLSPVGPRFLMAWLVAFNDGLLDACAPESVAAQLGRLAAAVDAGGPALDAPREEWAQAVTRWLPAASATAAAPAAAPAS
ncbi:MAG TPA: F0F1 ATP synthase subunit alpha [Steroidobacteraceae bacterium]|nr:F0F1 ATP synthase subunit alpha [Steroidobacteraceae bacterium]